MEYKGCLLAVKDMAVSRKFYETVLDQKVLMDIGVHVSFEGFSLQQGYGELIGIDSVSVMQKSNNFQVYFEVNDLDVWVQKLKNVSGLQWVHDIKEYPWGQRDIRIYDPDFHIVEIAEDMGNVIKRFLEQGLSVEDTAARTMYPVEIVKQYVTAK